MAIDDWDALRTAFLVAEIGTISAAARVLGVHHATVIRQIEGLEAKLGLRLFHRHARGYVPTEAGRAVAEVARATDMAIQRLLARLQALAGGVEGELILTCIPELAPLLLRPLGGLMAEHPGMRLIVRGETRILRLEAGEAHVALRVGARPEEPDAVVQAAGTLAVGVFAGDNYLARHGDRVDETRLADHRWIGPESEEPRPPFLRWLRKAIPKDALVCRSDDLSVQMAAVRAGLGLGFIPLPLAGAGLSLVLPPRAEWNVPLWLVSHVDFHRSPRVQAALSALKRGFGA